IAVDMTNCKGQTPLMYACAAGSPELVKLLLTQGADPWVGDRCGCRTALHYASMAGSVSCIEALMQHLPARDMTRQGVRYINARNMCGLTALHYAVFFDHMDAVEELLRHDPQLDAVTTCDVYVTCDPLSTPLHFAAVRGNVGVVRRLLAYHVQSTAPGGLPSRDPRLCCNYGQQLPWQVAASHHPSNRELVALLHPAQPLERALGLAGEGAGRGSSPLHVGPPALAALAAAALHAKLAEDLRAAQQQQQAALPSSPSTNTVASSLIGATLAAATLALEDRSSLSSLAPSPGASPKRPGSRPKQDEEDGWCGVCFAGAVSVAPAGCGHGVCLACASELSRGLLDKGRPKPLLCPFCRQEVAGFVTLAEGAKTVDTARRSSRQRCFC
ncbi:hypothetical protein Agub_g7188, partial [Astrephomene gubernaculifera]